MNFSCDRCQRRYTIADEKVQGRSFRVTCRQCGHAIVVKGGGQAAPQPSGPPAAAPTALPTRAATPAPSPGPIAAAPPPEPEPPPAPSGPRPSDQPPAVGHRDEHEDFFASEPTHRPRAAAERRHPLRLAAAVGLAVLVLLAGGGVGVSWWRAGPKPVDPPPTPLATGGGPTAAPGAMPAPAERAEPPAPAPEPPPAGLPPEPPAPQPGDPAPRAAGGRTGFESVGGGRDGGGDRQRRSLTIGAKDKRLLDLLGKKGDAAPAPVERTELDTGRGSLDEEAVRQVVAANATGFAACVTRAAKAAPRVDGGDRRATLNLTIEPSGVVSSAWISEAELDKSPLGRCLLGSARRMVFPAFSGREVDVAAPLSLTTTY